MFYKYITEDEHMWPNKERRWNGPTAQEVRTAKFKEKQEWLQSLAKKRR
jgi:hypothetical protein